MATVKQRENIDIDFIFNKKPISEEKTQKEMNEFLSEEDKKVAFLLENNLLSQIGKLQEVGFELKEIHKKDYYTRLYKNIISTPEATLREYLKNNLELPEKFLAIYFLVEMQERNSGYVLDISKVFTSFIDRVKKGLNNDPVERYKFDKLNSKEFVNELFDVWYDTNTKHINDIETKVINKKKFWFFTYHKNAKQVAQDLEYFSENGMQKHIRRARNFFRVPFKNDFFLKHVAMDKILKAKELLKKYEQIQNTLKNYEAGQHTNSWSYKANLLVKDDIESMIRMFEDKLKEHYQKNHEEIVEDIRASQDEEYLKKVMTRKLIKGVDDKFINSLPAESLTIVNQIKSMSEQLYQKEITDETKEIVEFLWKEKLPEVIQKYLNIDNEYRENLKNVQGKSAKELMLESLIVIKESLEYIEKDVNEENLKNLSIHTRYIKNAFKK